MNFGWPFYAARVELWTEEITGNSLHKKHIFHHCNGCRKQRGRSRSSVGNNWKQQSHHTYKTFNKFDKELEK